METTLRFPVWGVSVGIQSASCGALESFRRLYGGFAGATEADRSFLFRVAAKDLEISEVTTGKDSLRRDPAKKALRVFPLSGTNDVSDDNAAPQRKSKGRGTEGWT
jgi:hypothetical protein